MLALLVTGGVEAFADDGPLHGDILRFCDREGFINGPGGGDVIDDDVFGLVDPERIALHGGTFEVAGAEAYIADDDVVGSVDDGGESGNGYAISRGGLAGECEKRFVDVEVAVERDGAGEIEDDGAGSGSGLDGKAKAARA